MNEQENIALVRKLYEAFSRGDIKTILDHVTDDIEWSNPGPSTIPYSGERMGPAQVREFFDRLVGTQENVNLAIDEFIAQGDKVATLGRYTGNVKGTGRAFDSLVGHFFTIRDGKVARWIGLGDTANAVAAYSTASAASR
ncbi:MAG: nuclear transport factor 2 family protein [Acidobacteriaceae bacterium]|nr:nuclear transport factor 2 family protein [Acidobacteriaceae bacterium]MBV9503121.1 nuclear transport factor 2 family protein [Acidobacteriaceae bacterium]